MKRSVALLCLLGLAGGMAAVVLMWPGSPVEPPPASPEVPAPPRVFSLPPYTATRYLNTGPDARHIGSAACAACHASNHKSYLLTAHSRALGDVDAAAEPVGGAFEHKLSGRTYRVYRKDGELRHEEVMRTATGEEVTRIDLPLRYRVGSGHFCRTYLVEVDGFLHESPITWYESKQQWGMSPGYDFPQHWGFERPARIGCLVCHAGRVDATGESVHRLTFHEKAIGCENCHGPGSLHQELHQSGRGVAGQEDLTIVNPGRLPRVLGEAICASCHLSGPAGVNVRGREPGDFRPGRPLTDYQIHYLLEGESNRMTVVGHVEQLRQSACYQKSPELTCITCHDPHAREKPKDVVGHYRQKCLDCHASQPCGLPPEKRLKENPADNCAACHMPRGDTEIPHLAFSHHRIGVHQKPSPPAKTGGVPRLVPLDENPHLDEVEQQRNLGLAYMEAFRNPVHADHAAGFAQRAQQLLQTVHDRGLRDPETLFALAELAWHRQELHRAGPLVRELLAAPGPPPDTRAKALLLLAHCERSVYNHSAALAALEEAVKLRRYADDWRMLGMSYLDQNQPQPALAAFQKALLIRPYRHTTHLGLTESYGRLGDHRRAEEHFRKAQWLQRSNHD